MARAISATINPEVLAASTLDFYALMAAGTKCPLTATLGQSAGNKCVISAGNAQVEGIKENKRGTLQILDVTLRLIPSSAADDEIEFKFN